MPRRFWAVKLEIRAVAESPAARTFPRRLRPRQACFCRLPHRRYFVSFPPTRHFHLFSLLLQPHSTIPSIGDCHARIPPIGPSSINPSRLVLFARPLDTPGPIPDLYHSSKLGSKYIQAIYLLSNRTHVPNTQNPTCKHFVSHSIGRFCLHFANDFTPKIPCEHHSALRRCA